MGQRAGKAILLALSRRCDEKSSHQEHTELPSAGRQWVDLCVACMLGINAQVDPAEAAQLAQAGWGIARIRSLPPEEAALRLLRNPTVVPTLTGRP